VFKQIAMTKIESNHVNIACSPEEAFNYLTDLNNFKELLPQDKVSDWEADSNQCSFRIQGTVTISIVLKEGLPHHTIHLVSGAKSPFPFTLDIFLKEIEGGNCEAYEEFKAEINPFLKMMVEKPLRNLFNYIADRLVVVKGQA